MIEFFAVAKGFQFVSWSGDVEEVADVKAASSTIALFTDASITANFASNRPGCTGLEGLERGVDDPVNVGFLGLALLLPFGCVILRRKRS